MSYVVENLKILVADDHFLLRQVLINVMHEKKILTIDTAADGKVAREMIDKAYVDGRPYDIVFLDWEMPLISGIDVLKYFRDQPQFATTAFVMVTAVATQAHIKDAIKSGATAYLIKPISSASIAKRLDEILLWVAAHKKPFMKKPTGF